MSRFILVRHEAVKAGLHWDLRFEFPKEKNKWTSFVFRKDPTTLEKGERMSGVRSNDHDTENALFIGEIKEGYGKGKLIKYDEGDCEIIKFRNYQMTVKFNGKKLKGLHFLINIASVSRRQADYKKKIFMFIRSKKDI